MFRRQVFASTIEPGVADECLKVVASHNRKVCMECGTFQSNVQLLRDAGLDFTFLLSTLLQPPATSSDRPQSNIFDEPSFTAATPGAIYQYEPSPFVGSFSTPMPPENEIDGGAKVTAPLAVRSRPRDLLSPSDMPDTPGLVPPRSARRTPSASSRSRTPQDDEDGLR